MSIKEFAVGFVFVMVSE